MTRYSSAWTPLFLSLLALFSGSFGACSFAPTQEEPEAAQQKPGLISDTARNKVPVGLESAYIYEIDGQPVNYLRGSLHLPPGQHRIRVWPIDTAPRSNQIVPDLARIAMEHIEVLELTIDIKPGYRYVFAASTNISRTRSVIGADTHRFPENKYVIPVLVREVPPADYAEGAMGLGLIGLTMALPALIAPAAF